MSDGTNHHGIQMTANGPNSLRRDNSDSDISVGSCELRIVEDEGDVVDVESLSDKVDLTDEELERMFAQKDKEIAFLRKKVKDLKKTMKEQDEKITNLNKLVQKHETLLNRIVEVGGGALLENVKHELKAINEGERKSESRTDTVGVGQREQAKAKDQEHNSQPESAESSSSGSSGSTNQDTGSSASKKDNIQHKRNKAVTFGETFYEGETSQPRQSYQHKWQRDWHLDGHLGKRRRDWFLHDNRAPTQPYKRQASDPYYMSPTSNRHFRGRGQGYRGRGAQFNCRHSDSNFNNNYHYQSIKKFSVTNETSHPLNLNQNSNSGYYGVRVNEEVDKQPGNDTEDEVFQCPHCPWKFGERQNMEKHCEAQHKLYKCDMCGKEYGFEESLRRHLQSEH